MTKEPRNTAEKRNDLFRTVYNYIKTHKLIDEGDLVLAGVSGGADSMCLLEVLRSYQQVCEFRLQVVHVEHGIRGEESLRDAEYVREYCANHQIPCEIISVNAGEYAVRQHCSLEEAARQLRYDAFERCRAHVAGNAVVKIAVAHHREDQAETVLWQMIRGSDVRGMGGIHAQREHIIRPLLAVTRSDIEKFLQEADVVWREDITNTDRAYTRNRIRMDVLPVLTELNAQAIGHICETAHRLQETEDYLEKQMLICKERYVSFSEQTGQWQISSQLLQEHAVMIRRVLFDCMKCLAGSAKDLEMKHVRMLQELFGLQVGRAIQLPYDIAASRVYEGIALCKRNAENASQMQRMLRAEEIQMDVIEQFAYPEISKKKYTKWFDYDKIEHGVQIRERRSGDYLVIDEQGHRKKLGRYLMDEKIPQTAREHLIVVADGAHVLWVVGYRISEYYKVDEHTKRVLKVQWSGGKEDE